MGPSITTLFKAPAFRLLWFYEGEPWSDSEAADCSDWLLYQGQAGGSVYETKGGVG